MTSTFSSPRNDWNYVCVYKLIGTKIVVGCF
jgi:hypothetical protein